MLIFLIFIAIVLTECPEVLLIPAIIVFGIPLVVYLFVKLSKGGGGSSRGYSSYSSSTSVSNSRKMDNGFLWKGRYKNDYDPVVASFRKGYVFEGYDSGLHDFSYIKASYQNGYVYDGSNTSYLGTVLGRYENGYIYRGNSTSCSNLIGRYEDGKIYKGNSTAFGGDVIGIYEGDDEGAAAAAVVYLLK